MGNEVGRSNTHVANATGRNLRIFYSTDKLVVDEIITTAKIEGGGGIKNEEVEAHVSMGVGVQVTMRRDTRIRYLTLPAHDFNKIPGEGQIYISVFFEDTAGKGEFICHNFFIPSDRSIIITKNRNVKLQKYGGSLWEDEFGNRYS